MKKHFNIKLLASFILIFICFLTFNQNVEAKQVACNYRIENTESGTLDVTMTYDDSQSNSTPKFTYNNNGSIGYITVVGTNAKFTVKDLSGCPNSIYSSYSTEKGTTGYYMNFYLSESAAGNNSSTFNIRDNVNYSSKSKCEYSFAGDKVVIYYDKGKATTPQISVNGNFSDKNTEYNATFSSSNINSCPADIYASTTKKNGKTVYTVYLSKNDIPKKTKTTTYSNKSYKADDEVTINIKDKSKNQNKELTIEERCEKISKLKPYLTMIYKVLRFAAPAIIIVLSVVEFVGVVLSGEDDKMEKAKKHFISRLIIGVVIIILPSLIELVLRLAGIIDKDLTDIVCNFY